MDTLIKHALDGDAVNFVNRMKGKLGDVMTTGRDAITRTVAANMAGVEAVPQEDPSDDGATSDENAAASEDTEV